MRLWLGLSQDEIEAAREEGPPYWEAAAEGLAAEELISELVSNAVSEGVSKALTRAFKGK